MTDSILERLEKALKYADLLKYSHPDVEFGKATITNLATSDWVKDWNDGVRYLKNNGWIEEQASSYLSKRLNREDLEVIQPDVSKGKYEGGYFLSEEVADTMVVPAFAVIEKNHAGQSKRVIVCVSGSASKDEADLAMKSQEAIVTAVMPFLTACLDYAGENGLDITFTGYSRGSMVIVSASDALIQRCKEKNIGKEKSISVDFCPIAPLPIEKNVNYRDALPMGSGGDIAGDGKNLLSGDWSEYPCIIFHNQDYNEKYEGGWDYEKVWNYASNASTYLSNHGLENYAQTFKTLTKDPFYQSVLGQIEPQPCKVHYASRSGSYSKNLGKVTLQADESRLNVIMPSFFTKVVSGSGEAEIYCYDNPEKIDRVEFSEEDKVFIVVEGCRNDYTLNRLNHSSGVMLTSNTTEGGFYQKPDYIVYKDGILQLDPMKFSSLSEGTKDLLSYCHKTYASSLEKQSSTGILIASKH